MFTRILLPLDLTAKHRQAVDIAAELASQNSGDVTLLHVIEEIRGLSMDEEPEFFQRLEQTAKKDLDEIGRLFSERGIAWRTLIRYGNRVHEVARCAEEMRSDLIVVTSPRLDPEHPTLSWGSLSWKIGILGPCPVLMVK
jgi:nucleotide-binding universal stress UspA family protein